MRVADRVTDVTDRVQTRRLESKRDTLDRDNDRLRTELRVTREELNRERSARDDLLEALKGEGSVKAGTVKVKTKRRGGLVRLLIVGGGAYILGTRAGRERYERIKGWASDMKDRARSSGDDEVDGWSSTGNGGAGTGATSGMSGSAGPMTGTGSTSAGSTATTATPTKPGSTPSKPGSSGTSTSSSS